MGLVKVDVQTLAAGYRASKVIGSNVVNDANEAFGKIDDLPVSSDGKRPYAVLSIGGFLGMGTHLAVVSYHTPKFTDNKVTLPGGTKEGLQDVVRVQICYGLTPGGVVGFINSWTEQCRTEEDGERLVLRRWPSGCSPDIRDARKPSCGCEHSLQIPAATGPLCFWCEAESSNEIPSVDALLQLAGLGSVTRRYARNASLCAAPGPWPRLSTVPPVARRSLGWGRRIQRQFRSGYRRRSARSRRRRVVGWSSRRAAAGRVRTTTSLRQSVCAATADILWLLIRPDHVTPQQKTAQRCDHT